ncbi:hypothetical protein ACIBF1_35785 [Spirillospora sp. NPDC050679]
MWPGSLKAWTPGEAGLSAADRVEGLVMVTEASGPCDARLLSDHVAVHGFRAWVGRRPRPRAVQIRTCGSEGRAQVRQAFDVD